MFVVTEDWALVSHRLHLVKAAIASGDKVAVVARGSECRVVLEAIGVCFYCWPLRRGSLNLAKEIKSVLKLKNFVDEFEPELIHAVALKPVIYSGLVCKIYKHIRFIAAMGGIGFVFTSDKIKAKILRFPIKILLRWVLQNPKSRLILQNKDNIKNFEDHRIILPQNTILIRGSGVEIDKFIPSVLPKGVPLVVLPARLLKDKGICEFVEVASRIKSAGISARFILVGDIDNDNPETLTTSQIKQWVDSEIIEHWGRIEDMYEVYQQSTIVCLPSYAEGLPKALLEAASCCRPLVAFDVAGCREIVENNINGKLVEFGNLAELEKSLAELLLDKKKCLEMGLNGRKLVENNFSDTKINAQIFDVWKGMLLSND
ncbi:glycosyltransferase family 4 protein [Alphaproteobacteria bacterium]|nr:glycosyltransferase family 4 protein [Alphaproteobacteria bacterium]